MADPVTTNKLLFTPAHGADVDTWDVPANANWSGLDQALGGYTTLNAQGLSGTVALTTSQIIPLGFIVTGTPSGNLNYQVPAGKGGLWLVRNRATLGASITLGFSSASGGSTVNIPSATNIAISADGAASGMVDIDTGTGGAAGSNSQIQVNVLGALGTYAGFTMDGTTFHTPQLTVDGNAIFGAGAGAGSTITINGTAIAAPNGFSFNAGQFQMNAGGMLGIGTVPTAALLTIGGLLAISSGGVLFPDNKTITSGYQGQTLQIARTPVTTNGTFVGTYSTATGAQPTAAGGVALYSQAITLLSSTSVLEIEATVKGTPSAGDAFIIALFDGSAFIDMTFEVVVSATGSLNQLYLKTWVASPGAGARTYNLRIGANAGASWALNSTNNGASFTPQAGSISWISIKEIQPTS